MLKKLMGISEEKILCDLKSEIQHNKLPLVVFGHGQLARILVQKLVHAGIPVAAVALEDDYWMPGMMVGKAVVERFSLIKERLGTVNLVAGFQPVYAGLIRRLESDDQVNTLYLPYFDVLAYQCFPPDGNFLASNNYHTASLAHELTDVLSKQTLEGFVAFKRTGDITYVMPVIERNQYFPENIINLATDEVFIDCGAYVGDTIAEFVKRTGGHYEQIIAFEPDSQNLKCLRENTANVIKLKIVESAAHLGKGILYFNAGNDEFSRIGGPHAVAADSVDNVLDGSRCSYIKADIEGSEMEMLKGAVATVKRYQPKLAISVYHKRDDLVTIPSYIKKCNPAYRLALRMHSLYADLVLYALPD